MADLPVAAIVRIAKKSGAKRVGRDAAMILSAKAEDYIAQLTKEANKLAIHAGRKTLKEEDVGARGNVRVKISCLFLLFLFFRLILPQSFLFYS